MAPHDGCHDSGYSDDTHKKTLMEKPLFIECLRKVLNCSKLLMVMDIWSAEVPRW